MPKKNANKKVSWRGFVNVYLRPGDKAAIKQNLLDAEGFVQLVDTLATSGYKVSVAYSESGGFYTVTAYGNDWGSKNAGLALSLRHSDLIVAYSALNYVLDNVDPNEGWEEHFGSVGGSNDW